MNNKKCKTARLWKEVEDVVVPALRLSPVDRAVYAHLIRHTLLEGQQRIRFSMRWLARGSRVSLTPTRQALHRLVDKGAVRLIERTRWGHVVEVRRPEQIRPALAMRGPIARSERCGTGGVRRGRLAISLEEVDFMRTRHLREAIHRRDRGICFYCLCRLKPGSRCLDHVVPRIRAGRNSYRNLVSACIECNSRKCARPAADFLRQLYRQGRLSDPELTARLRALGELAGGKLRPTLPLNRPVFSSERQ